MKPHPALTLDSSVLRKRRWWPSVLWLLLALCVLALWLAFTLIDAFNLAPLQVSVNGAALVTDFDLAALQPAHKVVLAIGIAVALLVALVVAVGGMVVALLALVPIVLLTVAVPVLVAGVLAAIVLSPLLLLTWLLWRALRSAGPRSTTMPA